MADVAQRLPALRARAVRRLCRVLEVLEGRHTREENAPGAAWRQLTKFVVQHMRYALDGAPDRARTGKPLLRTDHGEAHAFGARVVLDQDLAPPLDHRAL